MYREKPGAGRGRRPVGDDGIPGLTKSKGASPAGGTPCETRPLRGRRQDGNGDQAARTSDAQWPHLVALIGMAIRQ